MKVLWFSATAAGYMPGKAGGWIQSLEEIINEKCRNLELAIAFENEIDSKKIRMNGTLYYPMYIKKGIADKLLYLVRPECKWERQKELAMSVINDFEPDLIQCFGSEWPYALLARDISMPIIIHMQGFTNIYNMSYNMVFNKEKYLLYNWWNLKEIISTVLDTKKRKYADEFERKVMTATHFFMGRTDWDFNIVKYYSPNANYYYCPEALRKDIYYSNTKWEYHSSDYVKLITISQAGMLKGNDIILKTAWILKNIFRFDFKWKVAGNKDSMMYFEKIYNIKCKDVNIEMIGMIDTLQIVEELSTANAYIHTAIIDNSPNSLCEAQVIGCPVIASNVGGITSLVEDKVTGILYPYNEPHRLAFEIMNLTSDIPMMKRLSENERSMALERHCPNKIAETITEVYNEVLKNECKR